MAEFYDTAKRLPKRQNPHSAEQREEDILAQRWDRLLQDGGAISAALSPTFQGIAPMALVSHDTCGKVNDAFWSDISCNA